MSKLRLTYFASRGRAESSRIALAYGGIDFEDRRLPGPTLFAGRADGSIASPFNQFPVLEVDGVPIAQSATILRYVAKLAGLYPTNPIEAAIAESIVDQLSDIGSGFLNILFSPQDEAAKVRLQYQLCPPCVYLINRRIYCRLPPLKSGQPPNFPP
jgi:glutathione S-transferase